MTLEGTNTYVVGRYVIDPGPNDPGHLERVREAVGGEIEGVLLTHGHSDHSEAVSALDAPVLWGEAMRESEMEALRRALEAGSPAALDDLGAQSTSSASTRIEAGPFTAVPTPGHAPDHVVFVYGDVCFCGDLILGHGSSIVPPAVAGGSLADYMRSLDTVEALDAELLAPGHGPWIAEPAGKIAEYRQHRRDRERRLLTALERGERSRAALRAEVWDDVPEQLRPAATFAMQAHLEKLAGDGAVALADLVE
jgi:glyoxylase-like metal-dependent hydrolase (beta-lactamase superfamily II)